jgi:hypothetical protein
MVPGESAYVLAVGARSEGSRMCFARHAASFPHLLTHVAEGKHHACVVGE